MKKRKSKKSRSKKPRMKSRLNPKQIRIRRKSRQRRRKRQCNKSQLQQARRYYELDMAKFRKETHKELIPDFGPDPPINDETLYRQTMKEFDELEAKQRPDTNLIFNLSNCGLEDRAVIEKLRDNPPYPYFGKDEESCETFASPIKVGVVELGEEPETESQMNLKEYKDGFEAQFRAEYIQQWAARPTLSRRIVKFFGKSWQILMEYLRA